MGATLSAPPREGLVRALPFEQIRADDAEGDGLSLEGYAAVFNSPTRIDSWEGTFDEQIARGAFRKTIRERTPVMQFDHGRHPLIGSIPIGTLSSLREDDRGLHVEGRLTDNWLIQPVRDAIRDGGVTGMSFRFSVIREEWRDTAGKLVKPEDLLRLLWDPGDRGPLMRTLKEVRVDELGPVVWPAYTDTTVDVRSREIIRSLTDPTVRAQVARALLLNPEGQHPADEPGDDTGDPRGTDPETAPPDDGHPEQDEEDRTDAPPGDGHPSASKPSRLDPARIRSDADLMAQYLALIVKRSGRYGG